MEIYLIISGDYGGSARVQVVCNSCINQLEQLYDPGYRYSLIAIPDIEKGLILSVVKPDVLRILKNQTVILHSADGNFKLLCISQQELESNNTTFIDISKLFMNKATNRASLKDIVYYLVGRRIQEYEVNSHNCEIDARYTSLAYLRYENKRQKNFRLPSIKR